MLFINLRDLEFLVTFLHIHLDATNIGATQSQVFYYDGGDGDDEFILTHCQNHELILSERLTPARFRCPTRFFTLLRILSRFALLVCLELYPWLSHQFSFQYRYLSYVYRKTFSFHKSQGSLVSCQNLSSSESDQLCSESFERPEMIWSRSCHRA